jgi:hypothetical protein
MRDCVALPTQGWLTLCLCDHLGNIQVLSARNLPTHPAANAVITGQAEIEKALLKPDVSQGLKVASRWVLHRKSKVCQQDCARAFLRLHEHLELGYL